MQAIQGIILFHFLLLWQKLTGTNIQIIPTNSGTATHADKHQTLSIADKKHEAKQEITQANKNGIFGPKKADRVICRKDAKKSPGEQSQRNDLPHTPVIDNRICHGLQSYTMLKGIRMFCVK